MDRATQFLSFCCLALFCSTAWSDPLSEAPSPQSNSQRLLDNALKQARAEQKRVYFVETGDNCGPCILMSRFLERHKSILGQDFIIVKIERPKDGANDPVLSRIRAGKSGGIPWSAILDGNGTVLATSNSADGKNLGFPLNRPEVDCFIEMIRSTSRHISRNELLDMGDCLLHQTILLELLKERREAAANSNEQGSTQRE